MNICVFCSASDIDRKYVEPSEVFASLIGKGGHSLVWGGSDKGVMKAVAAGTQAAGGKIIGITVDFLKDHAKSGSDEMHIMQSLAERRAMMMSRADSIVVMPGGIGTLDEMTEVLELKKHSKYAKPLVVLNTDGFFDGLKSQLERMDREGFLKSAKVNLPLSELIYFTDSPEDAMRYIESHVA